MGNPLRDLRAPSEFAANGQLIEFSEEIRNFEHLADIVEADLSALNPDKMPQDWRDSVVAGQLEFAVASEQGGLPVLEGQVAATVYAVCQRCLEPFRLPLEAELRFVFEDESTLDGQSDQYAGYEVWELAGQTLRPLDLVEEALIMELPFSAIHGDKADCNIADFTGQETKVDSGERITRPFAELKAQMESED